MSKSKVTISPQALCWRSRAALGLSGGAQVVLYHLMAHDSMGSLPAAAFTARSCATTGAIDLFSYVLTPAATSARLPSLPLWNDV